MVIVKATTVAGVMFALVAVGQVPARADIWCLHDSAGITSPMCAFSSAQDCIHAAIVGPSGMVCSQGNAGPPPLENKTRKGHAARSRQQADR
jgi:hypothetical protein